MASGKVLVVPSPGGARAMRASTASGAAAGTDPPTSVTRTRGCTSKGSPAKVEPLIPSGYVSTMLTAAGAAAEDFDREGKFV